MNFRKQRVRLEANYTKIRTKNYRPKYLKFKWFFFSPGN